MSVERCPICSDECEKGKRFCCEAHEFLYYEEHEAYYAEEDCNEAEKSFAIFKANLAEGLKEVENIDGQGLGDSIFKVLGQGIEDHLLDLKKDRE
jgi:hypothetical protein